MTFWTMANFCDLGQQPDLDTKTILVTRRYREYRNYDMDSRSPISSLMCSVWYQPQGAPPGELRVLQSGLRDGRHQDTV